MSHEIFINVTPGETRAARIEDGVLQELHVERDAQRGLVGNLYQGRVVRVLPGIQAAFVDIGLARTAFLHVGDIATPTGGVAATDVGIRALISEGDELLVQVIKDPIGSKGARLSTFISLASRLLVYMPRATGVGISARIDTPVERERLRVLLEQALEMVPASGGHILRTAAQGATAAALHADLVYLDRLWQHINSRRPQCRAGTLVHEELTLPLRMLRDELSGSVRRVLVDSDAELERMRRFAGEFVPHAAAKLEYSGGPRPLFDLHDVETQIGQALERRVALKSGGYLVIDQTEALTTIDVNTGAYVGRRDPEETSLRTNCEAADVIAHQLRLRNIGGIIVIDFIDLQIEAHRQQLLAAFQAALAGDRAHCQLAGVSSLGLVEMTRKRTRASLERVLCEPCTQCDGRGFQKSVETICREIHRDVLRRIRPGEPRPSVVLAHPQVIEQLEVDSVLRADCERALGSALRLQAEALNGIEQYDVICA